MHVAAGGIYRNNSTSVRAQAYASVYTRAFVSRYRCRIVNHREITGVYDGNYYISRDEMYATLFLDTLRLSSQVNRSMLDRYHDAMRSDVRPCLPLVIAIDSVYLNQIGFYDVFTFFRCIYVDQILPCVSLNGGGAEGGEENGILSHLQTERSRNC